MPSLTELADVAIGLNEDELTVLVLQAKRMQAGRKAYGPLDVANDPRDFIAEAVEEQFDAASYLAMEEIRLVNRLQDSNMSLLMALRRAQKRAELGPGLVKVGTLGSRAPGK